MWRDTPNFLDTPRTLTDLCRAEHLLVWALRAIGVGRGDCPLLAQTFHRSLGPKGPEALGAYFVLVKSIAMASRRRLAVHVPGCASLGADELAVLGIVAAAQSEADAEDPGLLRLRLRFLVAGEPNPVLARAARIVARALQRGGFSLPQRAEAPPSPDSPPELRVIH
jgi:hypothetical protein